MLVFLLLAGLGVLVIGAELLVRGASALAQGFGLSPLVIGLTVVAFGTSAPELTVSLGSALQGQVDVAMGNVLGSNIFNALFILGLCALVSPLQVSTPLIRRDIPIMLASALVILLLSLDRDLSGVNGALLLGVLIAYTLVQVRLGGDETAVSEASATPADTSTLHAILLIGAGLALLVLGTQGVVAGATGLARLLGVDELVIGLTLIAAGTSLPELATSLLASLREQRDIAVGNVVGSNIFNVLGVAGATALLAPDGLPLQDKLIHIDFSAMLLTCLICLPICFSGQRISRVEGALLLGLYGAYTLMLIAQATGRLHWPAWTSAVHLILLGSGCLLLVFVLWRQQREP